MPSYRYSSTTGTTYTFYENREKRKKHGETKTDNKEIYLKRRKKKNKDMSCLPLGDMVDTSKGANMTALSIVSMKTHGLFLSDMSGTCLGIEVSKE